MRSRGLIAVFLCVSSGAGSDAAFADSGARFDRHDVLYWSREYLRHSQYLRGKQRDVIVTWGWRALEFPVGAGSAYREVVPEHKELRFSNGSATLDVDGDGNEELIVGRYRREKATTQDIVWYERPAGKDKAPWIEHKIATVPGSEMPHDMQSVTLPVAGGPPLRGVVVAVDRKTVYLFEPLEDPRRPWWRHEIGVLPHAPQSGMAAGDVNGDGRTDIVSGMFWIEAPADPRRDKWAFHRFGAWDALHKWGGMNKHAVADFDGDGETEIAVDEAEQPGARLAIFKRDRARPAELWTSRTIDTGLYCPHSLDVADLDDDGRMDLIVGEMDAGGWEAPLNTRPRVYGYLNRGGLRFERVVLAEGLGVHEAKVAPRRLRGKIAYYGNSTTQPWLDGMMSHLSLWTVTAVPSGVVLRDDFERGLAPGWSWLREDSNGWIAREDGLHVRALPGTLWGKSNDAKNLLLRPAPARDFSVEVEVTNDPRVASEQAGLVLHGGDGAYVKLVKEKVKNGEVRLVLAREEGEAPKVIKESTFSAGATVVLRLVHAQGRLRAQFRLPAERSWQDLAECAAVTPAAGATLQVGLLAHVTGASDRWAHFSRFQLLEPGAPKLAAHER